MNKFLMFDNKIKNSNLKISKNFLYYMIAPIVILLVGLILICTVGFNGGADLRGASTFTIYANAEGAYGQPSAQYDINKDGEFDALCYHIVTVVKQERPDLGIERIFCVPQERDLRKGSRQFRREDYEDVVYLCPSFDGWYKSIYFRNCAMIDQSDVVIFCAEERKDSGAYKAYKYAKTKKEKYIVNLWGM